MGGKSNPAANAEQSALQNQTNLNNQLGGYVSQLANTNSSFYQTPLASTAQGYSAASGAISPSIGSLYSQVLGSGGDMSGTTGVNQNQTAQNLTNYAGNTGGTQLAGANSSLQSFFQNLMQNGLSGQYQNNAMSQLSQGKAQNDSQIMASATPGQNTQAALRDNQNSFLSNRANLAGSLAGQSQNMSLQGAQGVGATASNLDAQNLNMLNTANTAGQGANSTALQNIIAALQQGQTGLNNSTSFVGQGQSGLTSGMNALSGMASQAGAQAAQFGQTAAQTAQNNSLTGQLSSLGGLFGKVK